MKMVMKMVMVVMVVMVVPGVSSEHHVHHDHHDHDCELLRHLGEDAYRTKLLVGYTRAMPNASLHHVVSLTDVSLRAAKKCCVAGATEATEGDCFHAELRALFDQICLRAVDHSGSSPAVLSCCADAEMEARDRCLVALRKAHDGDLGTSDVTEDEELSPPPPPPEYKGDICKAHAEENAHLYDWLVWELSHRYPLTSLSLPVAMAGRFISGVTTCCLVEEDHVACMAALVEEFKTKVTQKIYKAKQKCQLLKSLEQHDSQDRILVLVSQRSPSLSVDEATRIAVKVEASMRSCCVKHAKGFCLYVKSAIHDEICLDDDLLSHHPNISECCRSLGSQRASCTQKASEKFQASLDVSSLWPVEDQCRMSHDHPEKMHNRVLWQIARRSLKSPVDQVMSMGSDYLHKLNACCEVHEADGKQKCYQKSVEEYYHLLAEADKNVAHWCKVYNAIGQDKLERKLIMMITLKMPHVTFQQADLVASHYAAIAKKCCSSGGHTDCFMHEFYDLVDEICTTHPKSIDQPNAIPAIVNCCVQGGNARFRCLYSLLNSPSSGGDGADAEGGAGGEGGHEVEVCSRAVCDVHDKEGFGYSRRELHKIVHRHPKLGSFEAEKLVTDHIDTVHTCCDAMEDLKAKDLLASRANKRVCQDVKRLGVDTFADNVLMPKLAKTFPAVSFGNISSASHDLAQIFSLCCDTDAHPKICIMKKIGPIHARLCSESSSLYPELDACCHMAPYGRLGCIYKLSHSSAGPQVASEGAEEVADHDAECSAEPQALKKRLVYEFAHRYRQATKSQVTSLASAYAKIVNACCAHEHRDACFDKAGETLRNKSAEALQQAAFMCKALKQQGREKFYERRVITFSRLVPEAPFKQISQLVRRFISTMGDCCGKDNVAGCLQDHRYLVHDELCEGVSSIPSAAACCSISNEEDRADCLSALHGNLSLPGVPFVSDHQLCHDRRWRSHDAFANLLWEFGRRHPRAADSQVEELAEGFSHIADACCDLADEKECIAKQKDDLRKAVSTAYSDAAQVCSSLQALGPEKFLGRMVLVFSQRAPNASYEQIAKLSHRFLAYADKCCGQGWSPGCFAEQRHIIHDEMCHDLEAISRVPALAKCCQISGSARAKCMETIPRGKPILDEALARFDGHKVCQMNADSPQELLGRMLYEFGRRHTDASVGEAKKIVTEWASGVKNCCAGNHSEEHDCLVSKKAAISVKIEQEQTKSHKICEQLQKEGHEAFEELVQIDFAIEARTLPVEKVVDFAHRYAQHVSRCCAHHSHCLLDETLHLYSSMCSDGSYLAAHDGYRKCCRLAPSEAAACHADHEKGHEVEHAKEVEHEKVEHEKVEHAEVKGTLAEGGAAMSCLRFRQQPGKYLQSLLYKAAHDAPPQVDHAQLRLQVHHFVEVTAKCCRAYDKTECFNHEIKEMKNAP